MADNSMEQQQQQQPDTKGDENLADVLEEVMSSLRLDVLSEVDSMINGLRTEMQGGTAPSGTDDGSTDGTGEQGELEALRQQLYQAQKEANEERIENAFNAACNGAGVHRDLTLSYARANSEITVKNRAVYVDGKPVDKYVQGITKTPLGKHLSTTPAKGVDVQRSDSAVRNPGTSAELFSQIFGGA